MSDSILSTESRLLLFVHYNKYGGLYEYVVYLLQSMRAYYKRVVFISNSALAAEDKARLGDLCDFIMERENIGFDFGAWKDALFKEGWESLEQYDRVTLMNDTVFGPIFDFGSILQKMETSLCDFWGMTNHREVKEIISELETPIPEHVQSYFLVFKQNVVHSDGFKKFWQTVEQESSVYKVIAKYEIQLTRILRKAGFAYSVVLNTLGLDATISPVLAYADFCVENGLPFIKTKALQYHAHPKYILDLIKRVSDYPVSLIEDYATDFFEPDKSVLICDKVSNIYAQKTHNSVDSLRIAIHLHVYYVDIAEKYARYFQDFSFQFDLYITTDSVDKSEKIKNIFSANNLTPHLKDIIIVENKGRDILPWLAISAVLSEYDLAAHFHTKKSAAAGASWAGVSWQQDIWDMIVAKAPYIVEAFASDKKLGVVIPDIPKYFRYAHPVTFVNEGHCVKSMIQLWKRIHCKKDANFKGYHTFVMPYGTMFWYRPQALKKLTSLDLWPEEIPSEPIPNNGTILHAIERLIVYVAWDAGYDYRIVPPAVPISAFVDNIVWNRLLAGSHSGRDLEPLPKGSLWQELFKQLRGPHKFKKMIKALCPYGILKLYRMIKKSDISKNQFFRDA